MILEEWRPILGYEGLYEASSLGTRLKRLAHSFVDRSGRTVTRTDRYIKGHPNQSGHVVLRLYKEGMSVNRQMHRLVCEAFHGPAPDGKPLALHRDDNTEDNSAANLYWGDWSDNQRDAVVNGVHGNTKKTHCKEGHPLSGDNLRINPSGSRECVKCGNLIRKNWRSERVPQELSPDDPRHGSGTGYAVYKCRCESCRTWASLERRTALERRKQEGLPEDDYRHGTSTGYKTWGCRCVECRGANASAEAKRKAKVK